MGGFRDCFQHVVVGAVLQEQFEQPERVPPAGDRHDHPLPPDGRLLIQPRGPGSRPAGRDGRRPRTPHAVPPAASTAGTPPRPRRPRGSPRTATPDPCHGHRPAADGRRGRDDRPGPRVGITARQLKPAPRRVEHGSGGGSPASTSCGEYARLREESLRPRRRGLRDAGVPGSLRHGRGVRSRCVRGSPYGPTPGCHSGVRVLSRSPETAPSSSWRENYFRDFRGTPRRFRPNGTGIAWRRPRSKWYRIHIIADRTEKSTGAGRRARNRRAEHGPHGLQAAGAARESRTPAAPRKLPEF